MPALDLSRANEVRDMFRLVHAIGRFADEHGTPNTVTPGELHDSYGAPAPLVTARLVNLMALHRELRAIGWAVKYERRTFTVDRYKPA